MVCLSFSLAQRDQVGVKVSLPPRLLDRADCLRRVETSRDLLISSGAERFVNSSTPVFQKK